MLICGAAVKIRRWLDEVDARPGRVFLTHTIVFGIVQVLLWAALAYAIEVRDRRMWIMFCVNVAIPPMYVWTTYKTAKTAWMGKPRDELSDFSIPACTIIALCWLLYVAISYWSLWPR